MTLSKKEKYRQQALHKAPHAEHPAKKPTSAVGVVVFLFMIIGAGIGFFAGDGNWLWILVGAALGAGGGYVFATQVVKNLTK